MAKSEMALHSALAALSTEPRTASLEQAVRTIEQALSQGEPLIAAHTAEVLLAEYPEHARLRQLHALALARAGAPSMANAALAQLAAERGADEETLGLLARTHKDLWLQSGDRAQLDRAYEAYARSYATSAGIWSGINAATLALARGEVQVARELATRVKSAASNSPHTDAKSLYWAEATVGEASMILGQVGEALQAYSRAVAAAPKLLGSIASTRRNLRLILALQGQDQNLAEGVFPSPLVLAFRGHRIDADDGPVRFPSSREAWVRERIEMAIDSLGARIGFAAAASGADLLFLEAMQERGLETHVVLPTTSEQFANANVAPSGEAWMRRFDTCLAAATRVVVLSHDIADAMAYQFGSVVLLGLARLRAESLFGTLRGLSVWDGKPGPIGGTASVVADWKQRGIEIDYIEPIASDRTLHETELGSAAAHGARTAQQETRGQSQRVISMLFADAVGFSKLREAQVPRFVDQFLGGVKGVMARQARPTLTANTWGDALYFTFDSPADANDLSLDLIEFVARERWPAYGLPEGLNFRVALHSGAAYPIVDPITGMAGFTGGQVSRAARIEPITVPGCVYCSEAHAALSALAGGDRYVCEYVGNVAFAKNYGTYPTYSLKRRMPLPDAVVTTVA